ncbi:hypothetical protein E5K00_11165 [Hymenobacter aquaticus]|uniref:Uncharacterized protein n=1 Tax=Hymenobacter aquaticus TaxID=1867101 RepID=A0A4Z0Q8I8_9BACT|nr:hypothetical protein [Hymenobacter aquaticus]TGE25719.1 hypothetical protein E5K00_11165 [Hymenobacter aquaticus]
MDVTWGWQPVECTPGTARAQGPVTEAEALAIYTEFPWAEQLRQLAARRQQGLPDVLPGLWFRRAPAEQLTLLARDEWTVLLGYAVGEQRYCYELSLSWWAHNLEPEDIIRMLFAGTLAAWPGWQHPDPYADFSPLAAP